jgi:superfamily II DNA or RNA helicase
VKFPLRPYQDAAAARCQAIWSSGVPSALVELPTGCGKTALAAKLIEDVVKGGKRAMFVAHRRMLIEQAAREIPKFTGIDCGVWMGDISERLWAPAIAASKDTLHFKNLDQLNAEDFGLLVLDEAHHAKKGSRYCRLREWAEKGGCPVLGITATPDRTDKSPLVGEGRPFAELAYRYPIWAWDGPSAINDGWLVPINQEHVHIDGLDFSAIREKKIWTDEEIEDVVNAEGVPLQMADATVRTMAGRPTIVFCPTVKFAYKMSELIDRYASGPVSVVVHGPHSDYKLPDEQRREREQAYRNGEVQYLVNVDVATEGADYPHTAGIVIMRPMKSRLRFAQCVGRGTRLFLGIPPADLLDMTAEERRQAIADSDKADCLVIGFYSNLADLKLWTNLEDVLGEDVDEEIVERARELKQGDTTQRLQKAKHLLEAEALFLCAEKERQKRFASERFKLFRPRAEIRRTSVNVYSPGAVNVGGDMKLEGELFAAAKAISTHERPSLKQARLAVMLGLKPGHAMRMTRRQVTGYIGDRFKAGIKPDYTLLRGVSKGLKNIFGGEG